MDLDKLLRDADSARNLRPHKGDVAGFRTNLAEGSLKSEPPSAIASVFGLLGGILLLFLCSIKAIPPGRAFALAARPIRHP